MNQIINEVWRSVDGYINYQVSNIGRIRNASTGKILKGIPHTAGYLHVKLTGTQGRRNEFIHRLVACEFINNPDNKPCVDHINHDKTDNTVDNLRWATHSENSKNMSKRSHTSSHYLGVSWDSRRQKWRASITTKGRMRHIGYFDLETDAAKAYDEQAMIDHGDYVNLNFTSSNH